MFLILPIKQRGGRCRDRMVVRFTLQLPVWSVHITTKVVSSNPVHGEVYSIKHWSSLSVTCDRSVDFSGYSNFRHKSSKWNIFESCVKHLTSNGQMMDQTFVYVVHNIRHLWVIMWELSVGLCPKNIYSFWIKLCYFILEVASVSL